MLSTSQSTSTVTNGGVTSWLTFSSQTAMSIPKIESAHIGLFFCDVGFVALSKAVGGGTATDVGPALGFEGPDGFLPTFAGSTFSAFSR